ncbi:Protein of unknown function [Gryllus bimaculatus]|nr:Protein of unknown function [Gryllus bimaculatus]
MQHDRATGGFVTCALYGGSAGLAGAAQDDHALGALHREHHLRPRRRRAGPRRGALLDPQDAARPLISSFFLNIVQIYYSILESRVLPDVLFRKNKQDIIDVEAEVDGE